MNFSLYACYAGDFQTCEREGREVQKLNPSDVDGYLVLAYAQLGQANYRKPRRPISNCKSSGREAHLWRLPAWPTSLFMKADTGRRGKFWKRDRRRSCGKKPDRAADNL